MQNSSGKQEPASDEHRQLKNLDQAPAQVVENLPAGDRRQPVLHSPVRTRDRALQPSEELPVAANPPVLPTSESQIAGRIVVVHFYVGRESGARPRPFDQIVAEQRVLRESPVRRFLERVDIVDPLPGEAALSVQILVHIGHRGRVRIDTRVAGVDRREEGLVRARERNSHARLDNSVTLGDPSDALIVIRAI